MSDLFRDLPKRRIQCKVKSNCKNGVKSFDLGSLQNPRIYQSDKLIPIPSSSDVARPLIKVGIKRKCLETMICSGKCKEMRRGVGIMNVNIRGLSRKGEERKLLTTESRQT